MFEGANISMNKNEYSFSQPNQVSNLNAIKKNAP